MTPPPTGNGPFACTVTTNGNNATITYSGDRGVRNELFRNGSWVQTVTGQSSTTINGGAGATYLVRVFSPALQQVTCTGGGGPVTPPAGGNFACTVVTNNGNANITYTGDQGTSTQLLRNGVWNRTTTGSTFTFIEGGAGSNYVVRIRGAAYTQPFQDIRCT